ncbi:Nucleotidylyl transferase [Mycena crocata]|nr:Nucleotidylyl transferase [Mycena crocata]
MSIMSLVSTSVLYATVPSLSVPHFLATAIVHAAQHTRNHLLIVLVADWFDRSSHGVSHWNDVQQLLTFVYVQATKIAQDMRRLLMQVDVLLQSPREAASLEESFAAADLVFRVAGDPAPLPPHLSSLPQETLTCNASPAPAPATAPSDTPFPVVALGGTFDHLHAGHKILLSMAAWIASEKLIVGVTDDALLTRKANAHVLESLAQRTATVRRFLTAFKPGLVYDIVPISDVYGPTGWDPNIQALVVSKETASGAAAIASHRAEKDLPALQTFTIDVISATSTSLSDEDAELLKQTKMSSTYIREWIVKTNSAAAT